MEAWGAIAPNGGEKGQADVELKEQPAADIGQLGLGCREVRPRHHVISPYLPSGRALATEHDALGRGRPCFSEPDAHRFHVQLLLEPVENFVADRAPIAKRDQPLALRFERLVT